MGYQASIERYRYTTLKNHPSGNNSDVEALCYMGVSGDLDLHDLNHAST